MMLIARFVLPLLFSLILFALALSPLVDRLVDRWFQSDVELRSQLVFNSIHDAVADLLSHQDLRGIKALFRSVTLDERLLAVTFCSVDGSRSITSERTPQAIPCTAGPPPVKPLFSVLEAPGGDLLVGVFPVRTEQQALGSLAIVHDLSFISKRSATAHFYAAAFLAVIGLVAAVVTLVTARLTLRGWVRKIQGTLRSRPDDLPQSKTEPAGELAPVMIELRSMLRELDANRRAIDDSRVVWTAETLHEIIGNELDGAEVVVVSNREPYIHNRRDDGSIAVQIPASGLVAAMEPITRACGGAWVAHGSGSADRAVVDAHDRLQVPPDEPAYTLRRVWLNDQEQEGYYYGFANEGLWPLCHLAFMRPIFRAGDWEQYVAVNRKFADAVKAETRGPRPIILVQDYHFALLPRMLRERLPEATIITFWHIPWPNAEAFAICPWRDQILHGLLGSTIVGFHTQFHCNNFFDTVDRFLECRIDREHATITVGGQASMIRSYPISIEWPPQALKRQHSVTECRKTVRQRLGLDPDIRLGVGVERFDYTKGILERLQAIRAFLEQNPDWVGRLSFIQIAAPTRSKLPSYQQLQSDAASLTEEINRQFGREDYRPVILIPRHHEPDEVYEYFRAVDFCLVSSLHDGMNLVAKEFVAARDDDQGVLILSTFAGASRELPEALIVNPYDPAGMARTITEALTLSPEHQRARMRLMRETVREHNVYRWAGRMLLDAARLRKRQSIVRRIAAVVPARPALIDESWLLPS